MDNFDDIKGLWHSASVEGLPAPEEIRDLIRRYRLRMLRKKVGLMSVAVLASVALVTILVVARPQSPLTYAASAVFVGSWLFLLTSGFRSFRRAQRVKDQDNKVFLQYLEEGRQGRIRYHKYTLPVLLSLNSVALLVYTPLSVVGYTLMGAYLLFIWFVVRPRQFRKKQRESDALRERLEKISKQL